MAVSHVFSNTIADATGTITVGDLSGGTSTVAATNLVRPIDWNSAHNQFYTLTGNTTGNSTASGTNVLFAGSGGIRIGGSTGSIVFSAKAPFTRSIFDPYPDVLAATAPTNQGSLLFNHVYFPDLQFDRVVFHISNTNATNSSGSHTVSLWFGLYSKNASTISLVTSTSSSTGVTHSGTVGSYSLYSGQRIFTIPMTTTITEGDYWIGILSRTTSGGANGSYSLIGISQSGVNFVGHFGSSHNTTYQERPGVGAYSASTSAIPNSVAFSQIQGSGSQMRRIIKVHFLSGTV